MFRRFNIIPLLTCTMLLAQPPRARAQERNGTLPRTADIQDAAALGVGRLVPDLELAGINGRKSTLSTALRDRRAMVVAMTSCWCPLSKMYAARLAALEDEFSEKGIGFVYVNTVEAEVQDSMREQIRDNGFDGLYLEDRQRTVATALGARTTTEVFLIDAGRTLLYRGAVDDQYGVGSARDAPQRQFLRDALEAVILGERIRIRATSAPGCLLDLPRNAAPPSDDRVTYFGRVARILADKCVTCHRRGGDAPFTLESYPALRGRLSMIEAVVREGLMPPWHEDAGDAERARRWSNNRVLDPAERRDLLAWLQSNRPLGHTTDAPVIPRLPNTWLIGRPDVLLSSPPLELPAEGPLQYGRLLVPTNLPEDRWISEFELRPVKNDTVHHALVWIVEPGDVLPETRVMPSDLQLLGGYSPGNGVLHYPAGTARRIPAGAVLLVDLYARPMGREMSSRLRIGLRDAAQPPAAEIRTRVLSAGALSIPAHSAASRNEAELPLTAGMRLTALLPYMRSRGTSLELQVTLPDGSSDVLLDARHYDYRWQIRYELRRPRDLPAGTLVRLVGLHDNTSANPNNPDPEVPVFSGPAATQEALLVVLETSRPVPETADAAKRGRAAFP